MGRDRAGGGAAAQADHQCGARRRVDDHRQMPDPPMREGGRVVGAGLMVAVDRQQQALVLARAKLMDDGGRFNPFFLPQQAGAGVALRHELRERIRRRPDRPAEYRDGDAADRQHG